MSQSARLPKKSRSNASNKQIIRQVASANGLRSLNSSPDTRGSNSAPLIRTATSTAESPKVHRSISRIQSAHNALEEFRRHPERFLSASNRYLPLLRRQALQAASHGLSDKQQQQREKNDVIRKPRVTISPPLSRLSTTSDYTYDDAKSFLSDDNDNEFVTIRLFFSKRFSSIAYLENLFKHLVGLNKHVKPIKNFVFPVNYP